MEECLDSFQYELAVAHCEKALQLEPQSLAILETAAPLFLEVGLTDRALEISFPLLVKGRAGFFT